MPTITFPTEDLKRFIEEDVKTETLREALSMLGTDVERMDDEETVVEIFPNRPDLLSVQGIARALRHFLGYADKVDEYATTDSQEIVHVEQSVASVRPHTVCAIVRGLELDDATIKHVIDVQEKLHVTFGRNRKRVAIGIYPLDKIKMPITFQAQAPEDIVFRPLESEEEMDARTLLKEHPTGKKYAHLLEDQDTYPVFRDASGKVLSVPPVINSDDVGKVTADTKEVFIECSGHDLKPLDEALRMICCALIDIGASVETMTVQYPDTKRLTPDLSVRKARIDRDYVLSRAGIPDDKLESSLARMGLNLEQDRISIPCYRVDFLHDVDVVEDALIGYGYQNIEPRIPQVSTVGELSRAWTRQRAMRDVLAGLGLIEVMSYALCSDGIELANPLSENYAALRTDLLSGLLDVLSKNTSRGYPQQLFEMGTVFEDAESSTGVAEIDRLGIVLAGEGMDYTVARQCLEAVARAMDWQLGFEEHSSERFIKGRCARISGTVSGVIGEIAPKQLVDRGVLHPVAALEITLPEF